MQSKSTRVRLAVGLLAILSIFGCAAGGHPTVIDGFSVGALEKCSPPIGPGDPARSCANLPALARVALDAREPSHAAITSVQEYTDATQPGPIDVTGNGPVPTLATRHPGPEVMVFVFTLADGTTHATGVACEETGPCIGVGTYPTE